MHTFDATFGGLYKGGRGSGSDLATHKHDVLTVLAATPARNAFPTSGCHAPLSAVSLHSAALSSTKFSNELQVVDHKLGPSTRSGALRRLRRTSGARDEHGRDRWRNSTKLDHAIAADIWTKIPTIVNLFSAQEAGPAGPSSMSSSTRPKEPRSTRALIRHRPMEPTGDRWTGRPRTVDLIPVLQVGGFGEPIAVLRPTGQFRSCRRRRGEANLEFKEAHLARS